MEDRLANVETRMDAVEESLGKLRITVHAINGEQQVLVGQMGKVETTVNTMSDQLTAIASFIEGTDKILGFTKKHWRTILKFGCGFVTAYGITNPSVQHTVLFVEKFFGL